ncbi:MAG TPA: carbohydrate ABC transporter permease [Candidatus Eisenbergiella merdigallinarum]|uniref:Carbohydrate ABC transporter permease n=1 Tax=Candidatus Eisenbergiella merdigallinarum TaxID=2838552 RepID=A0A9D2MU12_9FIRM|nr:carbohydrate ABC transporter permease [Candidatus Eisenbergiella merdigallinarum]
MKRKVMSAALFVVLLLTGVLTVVPFVWMVLSSFKTNAEISALEQTLLPRAFTLENYSSLQSNFNFLRYFGNSVFIAVIVTVLVIYISCICGFVLSKYQFRGKNLIFGFIMMTMMIPWSVTIISRYTMFVEAGLQDTYLSLILPAMVSGFGIFMMKQDIGALPDELLEAARIDGANEFSIFHKIVLPMSKNSISAIAIFQFLWVWEDYLWPYLMIDSEEKQLLAVGLTTFNGRYSTDYGGLFAATAISIIPVLIIYIIFQKRFVAGVAAGAVKG